VVARALPSSNVVIIKDAEGGQPIRRWFRQWRSARGESGRGDLYERLWAKVDAVLRKTRPATITFVWAQGETDARPGFAGQYEASLRGLLRQLKTDLRRDDVNVVIARLNTFKAGDPSWDAVRRAQVQVAQDEPYTAWVDTDDLPQSSQAHYSDAGYRALGERLAAASLQLIRRRDAAGRRG
jgi:hypothetical protein